jgi:hypothetical protein
MVLLLVAVTHIIILILVIGRVLPREPSLDSLVHGGTLESLLWYRVVCAKPRSGWVLACLVLRDMTATHHVSSTCRSLARMLILAAVTVVQASARSAVRISTSTARATGKRVHVVCLAVLLNLS